MQNIKSRAILYLAVCLALIAVFSQAEDAVTVGSPVKQQAVEKVAACGRGNTCAKRIGAGKYTDLCECQNSKCYGAPDAIRKVCV